MYEVARSRAQQPARPRRPEMWHGRAKVAAAGLKSFAIIFFGASFHSLFFLVFPLAFKIFREGLERVQTLRFSLNLCFWIEDCEDSRINLHSPSIYASLFSFPLLFDFLF